VERGGTDRFVEVVGERARVGGVHGARRAREERGDAVRPACEHVLSTGDGEDGVNGW
jgi:hypothetical protein